MSGEIWIGLDVGTTAVKAGAYRSDGACVAGAAAPSEVFQTNDGRSEQDMEEVRRTVFSVLCDLSRKIDTSRIASIGICAQGDGLWMIDNDNRPAAPAMLWNDTRAVDDLAALTRSGATAVIGRGCHTSLWTGTSGVLWRWFRSENPDAADRVAAIMTCSDWVGYTLTGELATDFSNATIPFLDIASREYGAAQLEALESEDLANRILPPRKAASVLGKITPGTARLTGLPEGLSVSVGTLDLGAMIVGMGMHRAGQTMMIMGTTAVVNILTESVTPEDAPVGASVLHPTSDAIIRVLAPTSGASAFDWFTGLHPQTLGGESSGEVAAKLNALVEDIPPGANGVTFLPYLAGERAPFVASDIRASFHGLTAATSKADMGRAVMEGAAFSLRHCFEEVSGLPTAPVQLTGGASKNGTWCQIIADIMGQPVLVSKASDQGLWGAACIGAAAAGRGDAVKLSKRDETLQSYAPDRGRNTLYDGAFSRYVTLSEASHEVLVRLNSD